MNYSFRILELKNGRKSLIIDPEDKQYTPLSGMINTEFRNFPGDILETVEAGLSGEKRSFAGNLYSIECDENELFSTIERSFDKSSFRLLVVDAETELLEYDEGFGKGVTGTDRLTGAETAVGSTGLEATLLPAI